MERVPVLFVALQPMVARFLAGAVGQRPGLAPPEPVKLAADLGAALWRRGPALVFLGGDDPAAGTMAIRFLEAGQIRLLVRVSTSGDLVRIDERGGVSSELKAHTAPELLSVVLRLLDARSQ